MTKAPKKISVIIKITVIAVILSVVIALNVVAGVLFDFFTIAFQGANVVATDFAQADELCQDIAGEGAVLLKNGEADGAPALPLTASDGEKIKINVFGWGASDGGFISGGSGSSAGNIDPDKKKSFMRALSEKGFEYNPELANMYSEYRRARANTNSLSGQENFFAIYEPDQSYFTPEIMSGALDFSDTALIVISRLGGEGQDLPRRQTVGTSGSGTTYDESRTYLELSENEENMINSVKKAGFKKVVVILNTCNIFECGFIDGDIDAALSIGAVGQSGALAIAELLKGERTPSGRTVDTYPYALESDPAYANSGRDQARFTDNGGVCDNNNYYVDYAEGVYVGYRYYETAAEEGYIDYDEVVQYPFGYGLSYTDFEWSVTEWKIKNGAALSADDEISVTLDVVNNGNVKGQDVVELYFTAPYVQGGIEKSEVELAAFCKTQDIEPGASERVTLSFKVRDMASYDCYDKNGNGFAGYELDGGEYKISLRTDAHSVADCENAEVEYTVSAGIKYETDGVTGNKVENRFTGSAATDNGISLDGTTSNANIVYMSRADFAGTFPHARKADRARGYTVSSSWLPTQKNTAEEFVFGQDGDASLTLNGKDMNEELIFALGSPGNFNNEELWESVLSQITLSEMSLLIRDAGYQTEEIKSIGKLRHHDLDGPSGFNTSNQTLFDGSDVYFIAYPVETVLAQSWNPLLAYSFGLGLGVEGEAGIAGLYAPGVNIHRNAFDGRNFEYFSEDPYLSGIMGAQTVKGAKANGLYCYVKHFAANESETRREGVCTFLTEQAMRELYCTPFEICVKQGNANAFMSSFNYIGGTWAGASYALLTQVLREEWGFKGSVVSDWCPGDLRSYMSIDRGLRAGNDLWLAGQHNIGESRISNINSNNEAGTTTRACMREATKNMLYTYCNTMYEHKHHDASQDKFVANVTTKGAREQFPYWFLFVIGLDVVALAGCGVWLFMIIGKIRKSKKQSNAE